MTTSSTLSASSRPASARISLAVAGTSSRRDARLPPWRAGGSRVHTSAFAFAMSIPATRSWRSWYSSSSTSCAGIFRALA